MSEEKQDNIFKINVPIITNEELKNLDYVIENDIDNIVNQISKTISKDRDVIFLKKVIDKLIKENEELKEQRDNAIKLRNELIEEQKITCISKDKIREIVEKSYNDIDYFNRDIRHDLRELL